MNEENKALVPEETGEAPDLPGAEAPGEKPEEASAAQEAEASGEKPEEVPADQETEGTGEEPEEAPEDPEAEGTGEEPEEAQAAPEVPETPPAVQLTIKQKVAKLPIALKIAALAAVVVLVLLTFFGIKSQLEKNNDAGKITLDVIEIEIKEILHTARLNTAEYMYKGVVGWFFEEENGKQTKAGFIKYAGKIKYGVDFDKIRVEKNEAKNTIVITVPPLIREPYVEDAECIFLNQSMRIRFNDSKYMNLMRKACIDHMNYNADKDDALQDAAEKYTRELVDSLTSPFFSGDEGFSYEIRMEE